MARATGSLLVALALGACSTTAAPVSAVRFHQAFVPQGQTVMIRPLDPAQAGSLEFASYANAVGARLEALGFRPAAGGAAAALVATVSTTTARREGAEGRSPVSVGVGVGGVGSHVGVSLGTSFGLGEKQARTSLLTTLAVRLTDAASGATVWEGRSEWQQADGKGASLAAAMPLLIDALFAQFPGPSGVTTSHTAPRK